MLFHKSIPCPGIPGLCFGAVITTAITVVLLLNLLLWLNLNYQLLKRGKAVVTDPSRRKMLLEEIVEEITDPFWIIIVSSFSWVADRIRFIKKYQNKLGLSCAKLHSD